MIDAKKWSSLKVFGEKVFPLTGWMRMSALLLPSASKLKEDGPSMAQSLS